MVLSLNLRIVLCLLCVCVCLLVFFSDIVQNLIISYIVFFSYIYIIHVFSMIFLRKSEKINKKTIKKSRISSDFLTKIQSNLQNSIKKHFKTLKHKYFLWFSYENPRKSTKKHTISSKIEMKARPGLETNSNEWNNWIKKKEKCMIFWIKMWILNWKWHEMVNKCWFLIENWYFYDIYVNLHVFFFYFLGFS